LLPSFFAERGIRDRLFAVLLAPTVLFPASYAYALYRLIRIIDGKHLGDV